MRVGISQTKIREDASRPLEMVCVISATPAPTEATARITKTHWFVKEHGTVPPKGKAFSDCAQCHTQAAQGDYSERSLKTPAGWRRGG